ncbi:MAG: CoA pyrophosphatase [Comamonadaceae bacterium]|nr:MAG: CoA pyrophosphatase [Comamonadaceae bacterium]
MQLSTALRIQIQRQLSAYDVHSLHAGGRRAAAVALTVVEEGWGANLTGFAEPGAWSTRAALLLTRRAAGLRNHPGQWALPGGSMDAGETPEEAALRELQEEVGLQLPPGAVLGRLDDFVTRSGFAITPVVVWGGPAPVLVENAAEVASIHRIPVEEFMRQDAPLLDAIEDSAHPVLRMPVGQQHWIAAPTAAFLYQFREVCIAGRATRVAHFEQPLFARR